MNQFFTPAILLALLAFCGTARAQSVGIGTTTPDASAALDVSSTSKGFLPPRLSQAQRNAIASPATGLIIYQTDGTPGLYQYDGSTWSQLGATGPTGPAGASSGLTVKPIAGFASSIPANTPNYVFVGPQATVTTNGTQKIVATISTPLGTTAGSTQANISICYRAASGGTILSLGYTYMTTTITTTRIIYSVSAAVSPGAGTWTVGLGVGSTTTAINSTDYVSGYVMVVD
jgi:hypothetical protein